MPASGGTGGSVATDASSTGETSTGDGGGLDSGAQDQGATVEGGGAAGAKVLLVVGAIPLVRTDIQLHAELASRGLMVEDVLDGASTTASAAGKRLVVISYSVESANVRGKFTDVPVPLMVMEHVLLDGLGMTTATGHGWMLNVSQISMTGGDSPLAAGLTGDVTIYEKAGGVFWGVPAASAIKVATLKDNPARPVIFAYPAGAMMISRAAPGKRLLFFLGGHLDNAQPLTPMGIKLLHAAIDWSVQ